MSKFVRNSTEAVNVLKNRFKGNWLISISVVTPIYSFHSVFTCKIVFT